MLSKQQQELLIKAAILAPSADNSQPFQYQWQPNGTLGLWIDKKRSGKASDKRFVLSDIALGAVIESIVIQASTINHSTRIDFFPEGEQSAHYVANLSFTAINTAKLKPEVAVTNLSDKTLAKAIPNRCTDRRFPFKGPVTTEIQQQLTSSAQQCQCDLQWFDSKNKIKAVIPVIQKAESIRFKSKILHQELFSTINFSQPQITEGMHISVLAIEKPAQPLFKQLAKWSVMRIFNKMGGARLLGFRSVKIPILFSPALAMITIKNTTRLDVLNSGRALQRVWLAATQAGLSVQPYAAPGVFSLGLIDCENTFNKEIQRVGEQLALHSGSTNGIMLLRLGYHAPIKHKTQRREDTSFSKG